MGLQNSRRTAGRAMESHPRHLCTQVGDWEAAAPFLAGGCGGLLYQFSLQAGVDTVPAPHEVPAPCASPRLACAEQGVPAAHVAR